MTLSSMGPFISAIEKAHQTRDPEKLRDMKDHFSMRRQDLHDARIKKGGLFYLMKKNYLKSLTD